MTDRAALCKELTATWHREIPIVEAMGAAVDSYDGRALTVRTPMQPNRNVHGTTFAGSLYSVCVLTG
jgi:thioesterase domain-containing protein